MSWHLLTKEHGLCDELNEKNEQMHLGLQAVTTSLGHRIQGTQIDIQTTKALVETTQHGLKSKIAGVMDDFTKGLNVTQCEFETQLKEGQA
jgi:ribosomal protein L6P/L9E